ncbi:MAG: hypothetical protein JWP12_2636 [Bacteroidetes bacterium]|nr:hypothetical protein [Bacteroidota bacterium]
MNITEETQLKQALLNKEITGIEFYNLGKGYMVFDEDHVWLINGGIEFTFGDAAFSFAWSSEKEFYDSLPQKINALTNELEVKELEAINIPGIKELTGTKITEAEITWNFYFDLDENFEPTEEKQYMPMGLMLSFSNGSKMQLAAVNYELDTENKKMDNVIFDSTGELLIALNHPVEIKLEEVTEE